MVDFAFVIEVSGFQHGDLPFYLKRLSIAPVRDGPSHSITLNTDFLRDHDERALSTYRFATRTIHGIDVDEPWLAYELRYDAVQSTLKHLIFTSERRLQTEYQNAPRVLLITKGKQKLKIVEELIPAGGVFKNFFVRDLFDYGCPPVHCLLGYRAPTATKAAFFAAWFAGSYRNFLAPSLSPAKNAQEEDWDN